MTLKLNRLAVSKKIRKLVNEGTPQRQAVAVALNMQREGRLTPSGGYKRSKTKSVSSKVKKHGG